MARKSFWGLFFTLVMLVGVALAAPAWADVQDGWDAYKRGDYTTAMKEWRASAEQGDADAQYRLANMYSQGLGVPQDYSEAVKWWRRAAKQGLVQAQHRLANMYKRGLGVPQDYAEAVNWYRKAAEKGDVSSQFSLAVTYGEMQDYSEAVKWYRRAAEQRDRIAKFAAYFIGQIYEQGERGVPQDYAEAVKWYRKAAEQGVGMAQIDLGVMYAEGRGVVKNDVKAHMLFNVAASQLGSFRAEKLRNELGKQMTLKDITKAQHMASECAQKDFEGCAQKDFKGCEF